MAVERPPIRRAGRHELFFSAVRRVAYARRVIRRGHDEPVYPRLAELAEQGEDAIERDDMEAMFDAEAAVVAELRRISEYSKTADQRGHYWLQMTNDRVWDAERKKMRPLTYAEKVEVMRRRFSISERQVERDIAHLPDKLRR